MAILYEVSMDEIDFEGDAAITIGGSPSPYVW